MFNFIQKFFVQKPFVWYIVTITITENSKVAWPLSHVCVVIVKINLKR